MDRDPVQGEQSRCEEGSQAGVPEAGGDGLSQAPPPPRFRKPPHGTLFLTVNLILFFFFFWPQHWTCGIFVP